LRNGNSLSAFSASSLFPTFQSLRIFRKNLLHNILTYEDALNKIPNSKFNYFEPRRINVKGAVLGNDLSAKLITLAGTVYYENRTDQTKNGGSSSFAADDAYSNYIGMEIASNMYFNHLGFQDAFKKWWERSGNTDYYSERKDLIDQYKIYSSQIRTPSNWVPDYDKRKSYNPFTPYRYNLSSETIKEQVEFGKQQAQLYTQERLAELNTRQRLHRY
jgi:hypothetical protein